MKSRERKSAQKAYNLQQFRQGWVGERCEIHRLLGDSGEPEIVRKAVIYNVFVKKKARCPQPGGLDRVSRKIYL